MSKDEIQTQMTAAGSKVARACPACGKWDGRVFGVQGGFAWRRCPACTTVYVDRAPAAAELAAVYDGYYHTGNLTVPEFVSRRLDAIIAPFGRYRRTGRLLDAGFGAGYLLAAAERAGWECWGQEVSPEPLRVARERGWHVVHGDLDEVDLPEARFDVVCMTEIVEHLVEPMQYIRAALRLLRPGGLLYLTTPNGRSLTSRLLGVQWSVYSAPEHVQLFSASALRKALQAVGFTTIRMASEGLNPAELRARWRGRAGAADRVRSAYAINEAMSSRASLRAVKWTVNRVLTLSRLGDGLKCWAERPAI